MKRLISLLALLVSLCALAPGAFSDGEGLPVPAGDALRGYSKKEGYVYVSLGAYPTDGDGTVRPILWRVLSTDGISAYLLSVQKLLYHQIVRVRHQQLHSLPVLCHRDVYGRGASGRLKEYRI